MSVRVKSGAAAMTAAVSQPAVRERPIIFSGPMVRAILAGTKTVTRRIVKPQPEGVAGATWIERGGEHHPCRDEICRGALDQIGSAIRCPYGRPGDVLWCRETWAPDPDREDTLTLPEYEGGKDPDAIQFRADERAAGEDRRYPEGVTFGVQRWRPSIFMPRWASRIMLEVVGVRVERLQSITPSDAVAEGVIDPAHGWDGNVYYPLRRFRDLWDRINGKRAPWSSNPWVWVVEFRRQP